MLWLHIAIIFMNILIDCLSILHDYYLSPIVYQISISLEARKIPKYYHLTNQPTTQQLNDQQLDD